MKEPIVRTITGIILVAVIAGSILSGSLLFLIIICMIYALAVRELFSAVKPDRPITAFLTSLSGGIFFPLLFLSLEYGLSPFWLILPATGSLGGLFLSGLGRVTGLTIGWLALPLAAFLLLGWWPEEQDSYRAVYPLAVISLIWVSDTMAYVTGSLAGRHFMAPRLSPGKTWEGFAGGILFTLAGGWLIAGITHTYSTGAWLLIAMTVSLASFFGDLFESGLKRRLQVKNLGGILPGHGGVLDRFDSLLFAAPAALILMLILK